MPKVKENERLKAAAKVREYLARHVAGDPAARGLSLDDIASGAKVSRTPLSDPTCPIMMAVRAEIAVARVPAVSPVAPTATLGPPTVDELRERARANAKPGLEHLADADLSARIRRAQQAAGRVMTQWLGHHGRGGAVDDAALAHHDLEGTLWALRRIADELGVLVELREEREAARAPADAHDVSRQPQTSLLL